MRFNKLPKSQSGAVLVMGLIFLVIMTILGGASMTSSTIGEKMTGNLLNLNIAFQSAESSLKDGENWLNTQTEKPTSVLTCTTTPCDVWQLNTLPDLSIQSHAWWLVNGRAFSSSMGNSMVANEPRHLIEEEYFIPDDLNPDTLANGIGLFYYRVTSRGTGGTDTAESILQSTFVTRFN